MGYCGTPLAKPRLFIATEPHRVRATWISLFATALIACGGADDATPSPEEVSKSDVASVSGKGDSTQLAEQCEVLGEEPDCDPCAAGGWYGDGTCDDFCPRPDADCGIEDYSIRVDLAEGFSTDLEVVYRATKDSWFCTDGADGGRIPELARKRIRGECVANADATKTCDFTFSNELGDGCQSVLDQINLLPLFEWDVLGAWTSIEIARDDALADEEVQNVECLVNMDVVDEAARVGEATSRALWCGDAGLRHTSNGTAHFVVGGAP